MKKARLKSLAALVLTFALTLSVGCQSSPSESSGSQATDPGASAESGSSTGEPIELHVLTNWTSTSLFTEPINELIDSMNESGKYNITYEGLPSSDARTKLTVSMSAGTPPDVACCTYNYAIVFSDQGLLMDWSTVYDDPKYPEFKEWFSEDVLNAPVDSSGRIMLVPHEAAIDGLFCNMEVFEQYGWELPETWDDLIELCHKANEQGVAPLVTGGADQRFAWLASIMLGRTGGLDSAIALTSGEAMTSWDDPQYGFVASMEKLQELVDAGGFAKGVVGLSMSEADQMFARGEAAMYYEGAWKPADFAKAGGEDFVNKVQRIDFPSMNDQPNGDNDVHTGGIGSGFFIPSGLSEEKTAAAIEFVLAFNNPEFNVPIMEQGTFVWAGNAEYDKSKVSDLMNSMIEAYHAADGFIVSMDALAPPAVELAVKQTAFPGIISGELDVNGAVSAVNDAAKQYVEENK